MHAKQLLLGLIIGLFGVFVNLTPLGLTLEEKFGLYWLFHSRGAVTAPDDVVVVAIDQTSATELDLPITPRSWPRELHARLINKLTAAGAQVIVFDLLFDTPGIIPEDNIKLAHAMQEAGNVIVAERLVFEESKINIDTGDYLYELIEQEGPSQLLPEIAEASVAHTSFPLPKAARVDHFWTFKTGAGDSPTMPVAALQTFALDVYDEFIRLLHQANPIHAEKLPANNDALDVEDLIFTLRNIFISDPKIAPSMHASLSRDNNLDAAKKRKIIALLNLYTGDDMRYLNLYGPPRSIETIPYHQVLKLNDSHQTNQINFKDKVVFVGFSAATQPEQDKVRDDYHTVFSNPDGLFISGVEIAATAYVNLLHSKTIQPFSFTASLGLLFVFGFVISLIFLLLPNRFSIILGSLLTIAYISVVLYQFKQTAIWLPLIVPMLQLPLALFGAVLLRYLNAKKEREQLRVAFGRFIPERVVNDIAKNSGAILTNNRLVFGICLATDADMYTSLAEKMDPMRLSELMNDYYNVLFEPVRRNDGIVSDVVGDAILAIWAAPKKNINLRRKACLACLEMTQALTEFNASDKEPTLPTRIGLHAGEMFLGVIGAIDHWEYRAVGDIVNTSNRIQGANKYLGTRLLVSSETVADLEEFLVRPLGDFLLAGRSSPVSLTELITQKSLANDQQQWLCEKFSYALDAYQAQEWQQAINHFSEIRKIFPNDGPTRFFLTYCQQYMQTPPIDLWNPAIRLENK